MENYVNEIQQLKCGVLIENQYLYRHWAYFTWHEKQIADNIVFMVK